MQAAWSWGLGVWSKNLKNKCKAVSILLVGFVLLTGCTGESGSILLSGTIEATEADVNAEVNGRVIKILKGEGSSISIGDSIAFVDSSSAALQVQSAEAALKAAQARLEELKAGSRPEELKQAEAVKEVAKAKLDELEGGSRSEQVAQAEASYVQAQEGVATAQKNYDYRMQNLKKLQELLQNGGISQQQADDAENLADTAYQQLVNAKVQKRIAQEQLELLRNGATSKAIRAAQANYDQTVAKLKIL